MPPLVLAACSSGPAVGDATPNPAHPGDTLVVTGSGLSAPAFIALRPIPDGPPTTLDGVRVAGGTSARVELPHLPPGDYVVEVLTDGRALTAPERLTLLDPTSEAVCTNEWTMNTAVALTRGTVRIDRFDASGARVTDEVPIADVIRVEYETVSLDDGAVCSVIWLRTADGRRTPFDRRVGHLLEERARRLADDLDRPLVRPQQDDAVAEP